ncbi:hypothetical protein M0R04_14820 [Candidatus Dojkabacteria bacterium]|jgi:hypothetical protein|nr:hypothetical protein [Candidatus Dojkabacteria bacterium]
MDEKEKSLIERCKESYNSRMEDIKILNELRALDDNGDFPNILEKLKYDYGAPEEYGLSFDYVEPGTFKGQREPYLRFQISWGGPSEEFRIFANDEIEFWFLDWFCGEHINVTGTDAEEVFNFLGGSDYEELKSLVHIE